MDKLKNVDRILLLQTWVRIVESGSLTAAAKQLGTTQPTVSRRLSSLELLLDCKLMLRTTHQLKLTDDGELCYQHAKLMLTQWNELEETVGKATLRLKGHLKVRAPHAFGQHQLAKPLVDFLQHYPEMKIDWILNDNTPDFLTDNIDCALHVGPVNYTNVVVARLITYVPRILVASPKLIEKHGIAENIDQLAQWPWIAVSTFYRHELTVKNKQFQHDIALNFTPILATDNIYSATQCAREGLGVAAISSWLVEPLIKSGELVQLFPEWQPEPLPIYIVYPYANYYPKRLTVFMDAMAKAIHEIADAENLLHV